MRHRQLSRQRRRGRCPRDGRSRRPVPPPPTGVHRHGFPDRLVTESARGAVGLVERIRPAVLQPTTNHLNAQVALALAERFGLPVVYEVRGFLEETWASHPERDEDAARQCERYRAARAVETASMAAADAVVTLSETMRREISRAAAARGRRRGPERRRRRAASAGPRDRDRLAARLGIGPDEPVVGYISAFTAYEGIRYLIGAVAALRAPRPAGPAPARRRRRGPSEPSSSRAPPASGSTTARSSCRGGCRTATSWLLLDSSTCSSSRAPPTGSSALVTPAQAVRGDGDGAGARRQRRAAAARDRHPERDRARVPATGLRPPGGRHRRRARRSGAASAAGSAGTRVGRRRHARGRTTGRATASSTSDSAAA